MDGWDKPGHDDWSIYFAASGVPRKAGGDVFAAWGTQLQLLLNEAQAAGKVDPRLDPKDAAAFLIEAYEGALIRMKVDGGSAAFDRFKRFALGALSSKPAAGCP